MNWDNLQDQVLAMAGTDEFKAFVFGALFAVGVRIIRMAISWLRSSGAES